MHGDLLREQILELRLSLTRWCLHQSGVNFHHTLFYFELIIFMKDAASPRQTTTLAKTQSFGSGRFKFEMVVVVVGMVIMMMV